MNVAQQRDIGSWVKPVVGVVPAAYGASTTNGSTIDRDGYLSAVLFVKTGAVTGGPSTIGVDVKLQESETGTSNWADITGAAITQIGAANSNARVDVSLGGARRYLRVVSVVDFGGTGTSPTIGVDATVILGGAVKLPA